MTEDIYLKRIERKIEIEEKNIFRLKKELDEKEAMVQALKDILNPPAKIR